MKNIVSGIRLLRLIVIISLGVFASPVAFAGSLSETKAEKLIRAEEDIKNLYHQIATHDGALEVARAIGAWNKAGGFEVRLSAEYGKLLSKTSTRYVMRLNPRTAEAIKIDIDVTGIALPNAGTPYALVEFTWTYTDLPIELKPLAVHGGTGRATLREFTDGWRINRLERSTSYRPIQLGSSDRRWVAERTKRIAALRQQIAKTLAEKAAQERRQFIAAFCGTFTPTKEVSVQKFRVKNMLSQTYVLTITVTDADVRVTYPNGKIDITRIIPFAMMAQWKLADSRRPTLWLDRRYHGYVRFADAAFGHNDRDSFAPLRYARQIELGIGLDKSEKQDIERAITQAYNDWVNGKMTTHRLVLPQRVPRGYGRICAIKPIQSLEAQQANAAKVANLKLEEALSEGIRATVTLGPNRQTKIALRRDAGEVVVTYPALNCTGVWRPTDNSSTILSFREVMSGGGSDCPEDGVGRISLDPLGEVLVEWRSSKPVPSTL